MVPSQEANGDKFRDFFFFYFLHHNCMLTVFIKIASMRQFKNFVGSQKQVRISHGKRAISVRAIEVRLYLLLYKGICCG